MVVKFYESKFKRTCGEQYSLMKLGEICGIV